MFRNITGGIAADTVCNEVFVFDDNFPLHYQPPVDTLDVVIVVCLISIYIASFGKTSDFHTNFGIHYLHLQIDACIY